MNDPYKYDVALSFLADDEPLAFECADRIRDRVKIFIYFGKQKDLIGNDGIDRFSKVFGEESRVVVVLYREAWGQTKWTRIEETAIKARLLETGYEFLLMVPLNTPAKLPVWYPPQWLWADVVRYGIDGVASSIETRVQASGGMIRSESAVDNAARLDRKLVFKADCLNWRNTSEGYLAANEEVKKLFSGLDRLATEVSDQSERIQVKCTRDGVQNCTISSLGSGVSVSWGHSLYHSDTLADTRLKVTLFQSPSEFGRQPETIKQIIYDADLDLSRQAGSREREGKRRFVKSSQLADDCLNLLVSRITGLVENR